MLGLPSLPAVLAARPAAMVSVSPLQWQQLADAHAGGAHRREFDDAWANGASFLVAVDGLRGRRPRVIEWKGGHRAAGDEAAPVDLRVDHVYLVSCKYRSHILHNSSPRQLFEHLLGPGGSARSTDWFGYTAPRQYQDLYDAVRRSPDPDPRWPPGVGVEREETADLGLPAAVGALTVPHRRALAARLKPGWPEGVQPLVAALTDAVADASARHWRRALGTATRRETMLWRLLRIGSAPYFVLGTTPEGPLRLRVATPWDWRQQFRLREFSVEPQAGGQARVGWATVVSDRHSGVDRAVEGHVEIRWSHGRFAQPPEAKVYLDTPHALVPGYFPLD